LLLIQHATAPMYYPVPRRATARDVCVIDAVYTTNGELVTYPHYLSVWRRIARRLRKAADHPGPPHGHPLFDGHPWSAAALTEALTVIDHEPDRDPVPAIRSPSSTQGYCVVGLLLVTASMRSSGRPLARLVALADHGAVAPTAAMMVFTDLAQVVVASKAAELRTRLVDVCVAVADGLDSPTRAEVLEVSRRLCGPLRIVVDGPPGSGKSTLVNALLSRRRGADASR
jgi:hypothetical protein